ncbi:MAG TPA: mechanosensitive ion channel family protein [Polyangiaceae bacterium]|nr:mechanosensitive ion channel family protein [Polyangiaceae bacterium]
MSYDDPTSWLSPQFWAGIWRGTVAWAVQALPKVLIVLLLGFVLLKLVDWGAKRLTAHTMAQANGSEASLAREHQKRAETLVGILRKCCVIVIWLLVAMLVLMQVGVNVAPLIAGAGIVGLAVGFGSQELVRDVITGFFVLLENQVRKGDVAVINGTGGLVEAIGLRTITLRDQSGTVHVFQHGKISSLANMTKEWSAMVFDISVSYKENPDEVMQVMREVSEALRADPQFAAKILEPMEVFGVDSFKDGNIVVQARLKTIPSEQWTVGREFRRRLKMAFDAHGIEIPLPNRTVYVDDADDEDDAPPRRQPAQSEPARARSAPIGARLDNGGSGGRR